MKWRELVAEAVNALAEAEIVDPEISAKAIAQRATGAEGLDWLATSEEHAGKRHLASFDAMLVRRKTGEPLQYVLGHWGFRHLDLFVDKRVLIPRPETEVIVGFALDEVERLAASSAPPITVADLGSGSGAIGLSMAYEHQHTDVWLTDISEDALAVARANIAGIGRAGTRVRVAKGDWFGALPPELQGRVGVVVSNPPYVAADDDVDPQVSWEPPNALFAETVNSEVKASQYLDHLVEAGPAWLVDDGALVVEMAPSQVEPMVRRARLRFAQVDSVTDLSQRLRGIVARFPLRS